MKEFHVCYENGIRNQQNIHCSMFIVIINRMFSFMRKKRVYYTRLPPMLQSQLNVNGKWLNCINKFSIQLIWNFEMCGNKRNVHAAGVAPYFLSLSMIHRNMPGMCKHYNNNIAAKRTAPHCKHWNQGVSNLINCLCYVSAIFWGWNCCHCGNIYSSTMKIAKTHWNA